MKIIKRVRGRGMPLPLDDVDTDQIMPQRFLSRVERTGYGQFVFDNWRKDPAFVLNDERFRGAKILVAGRNFGSGSSREHAVWGLQQFGFDAVVAPSFSDIFAGNSVQCGLVPITLDQDSCRRLQRDVGHEPGTLIDIDLDRCTVTWAGSTTPFQVDPRSRDALLHGRDEISSILRHITAIEQHETSRGIWMPEVATGSGSDSALT